MNYARRMRTWGQSQRYIAAIAGRYRGWAISRQPGMRIVGMRIVGMRIVGMRIGARNRGICGRVARIAARQLVASDGLAAVWLSSSSMASAGLIW